jgi:hypothetical protein
VIAFGICPTLVDTCTALGRVGTKTSLGGRLRKRHPTIEWRKKWNSKVDPFRRGRVLVVECYSRGQYLWQHKLTIKPDILLDASDDGRRKTQTQEFTSERELNAFYEKGAVSFTGHE